MMPQANLLFLIYTFSRITRKFWCSSVNQPLDFVLALTMSLCSAALFSWNVRFQKVIRQRQDEFYYSRLDLITFKSVERIHHIFCLVIWNKKIYIMSQSLKKFSKIVDQQSCLRLSVRKELQNHKVFTVIIYKWRKHGAILYFPLCISLHPVLNTVDSQSWFFNSRCGAMKIFFVFWKFVFYANITFFSAIHIYIIARHIK